MLTEHGHIHISTGFMLVVLLFIFGITGLILWYRSRKPKSAIPGFGSGAKPYSQSYSAPGASFIPDTGKYVNAPGSMYAPSPQVIVQHDSGSDLLTGVLLGEALSGPRGGTVVEREVRTGPIEPPPRSTEDSGGFTWDSGSSSSASSSDSSSDSSSAADSSGFDISW
jgi:hypothetical protein